VPFDRVALGSKQPPLTFESLEASKRPDVAFNRFRIKLANFFNDFLPAYNIPLPGGKRVKFEKTDTVSSIIPASGALISQYLVLIDYRAPLPQG